MARRLLATVANSPIAHMLAHTLRQMGYRAVVTVGDLDGPNWLMPADIWIEDGHVMDDPKAAQEIHSVIAGFVEPAENSDAAAGDGDSQGP